VDGSKLVPEFTPTVKDYTVDLPRASSSVVITVDPAASRSTMTINGSALEAGKPQSLKSPVSKIEISVKSPDETETASYTVTVNRK
jgi:hypothetical protein